MVNRVVRAGVGRHQRLAAAAAVAGIRPASEQLLAKLARTLTPDGS